MTDETPRPTLVGQTVSHYRIERQIGSGGMGAVYLAQDEALERSVAIKAIRHDRQLDEGTRARFQREARVLSKLDHPGICRVYDYIVGEESDFLVLELISGRTLAEHMRDALPRREALDIAEQIVAVLAVAHGQGIVHRDLKPANVMRTEDARIKVLDFGLARTLGGTPEPEPSTNGGPHDSQGWSSSTGTLTEAGTIVGTLRYMSPEQAWAQPLSTASDMYSFGLMLQELLTGEGAYPLGLTPAETWARAKHAGTLPFRSGDRELDLLVRELLSPIAMERPSAVETAQRLTRVRTRPRRRLVAALAATAVLVTLAGVTKYVFDLDQARGEAVLAQQDAERRRDEADTARREAELQRLRAVAARDEADQRRSQAEALIGGMLGDLRPKLETIGRLDVLDDVGALALSYFDAIPIEMQSRGERVSRAGVLYQVGELRRNRGKLNEARELYAEALQSLERLEPEAGEDLRWLKALGDSQYYVGFGLFEAQDFDSAAEWWNAYRETTERGLALSGRAPLWRKEVAMAHTNLGALAKTRGDFPEAHRHFDASLAGWRALVEESPSDLQLRRDMADVLSWRGTALLEDPDQDLARASLHFEEERDLRLALCSASPQDVTLKVQLATCEAYLARVAIEDGRFEDSLSYCERAVERARTLVEHDPQNASWRHELARHLKLMADALRTLGEFDAALEAASESEVVFIELCRLEPSRSALCKEAEGVGTLCETLQLLVEGKQ